MTLLVYCCISNIVITNNSIGILLQIGVLLFFCSLFCIGVVGYEPIRS